MHKSSIFIFFLIFYIFWIFINNLYWNLNTSLLVLLLIVVLFLWFIIHKKTYYLLFTISIIWFIFWIFISNINLKTIEKNTNYISSFLIEKQDIIVEIQNIKKVNEDNIVYAWKLLKINNIQTDLKIKCEIFINSKIRLKKWTIISSKSKIYQYKDSDNFKYKQYMLSNWFYFKFYPYFYSTIWENKINSLELKIIDIRTYLLKIINKIYTKQESIFLWWILLWAREELPKELKNNFNNSWLTHFIAVSGFNITIIIIFLSYFIKIFPDYIKFLFIFCFIIIFWILVWFSAPVIRASIMWIIWYMILLSWRKWNILSIILLTAALMVTYSPLSLNYDVSFHLSFLAVIWIVYCQKFYENIFSFITNILEIRTAFSLTMSALTFSLPVMLFNFWQVSIISPISNILVSWTIPLTMLLWFISIVVYNVLPTLGIIIWYIPWLLLKWDILIVNFFGWNALSTIKYDFWKYSWYYEIIYFLIICFIISYFRQKKEPQI